MQHTIWSKSLYELGIEHGEQRPFQTAARCFHAACTADPDNKEAWRELALMQMKLGQLPRATQAIRQAIKLNPISPRNLTIAALIDADKAQFPQALQWIKLAQSYEPDNPGLDLIEADIHRLSGNLVEAEQALQRSADKGMDEPEIESRRCEFLRVQHNFDELDTALKTLLANHEQLPRVQVMLSELQLGQENYAEGWINHEARLRIEDQPILRNYPWPYWNGENLQNKTLLVYGEQGIGDEILFSSCLPDLIELSKHIIFVCEDRLAPIFSKSFPDIKTLSFAEVPQLADHNRQSVDYCVAIGSLPLHFRQSATDFPAHNGYLQAADEWIQPWREKLQNLGNGLKIGIAWQGGLMRTGQLTRSLQPVQLMPLMELPGIQFINIQHGKVRRELEWLTEKHKLPVTNWPLDTKNITELAGLVSALDLIITPCCSLVHLAGALGKPVWVMTPKVAAWRYLNEGETMPWYPSARLFRQTESGDWTSVIAKIQEQLHELVNPGAM